MSSIRTKTYCSTFRMFGMQKFYSNTGNFAHIKLNLDGINGVFSVGCVWTDGTDIYYSRDSNQYVLNKETKVWEPKKWNGMGIFDGDDIWSDGTNIYYSDSAYNKQRILNGDTWETKTWSTTNPVYPNAIWTDGDNIYFSHYNGEHCILNKETKDWETKSWNISNMNGTKVWSDGTDIYYSMNQSTNYVLNGDTWEETTFTGYAYITYPTDIWSDGTNTYYSNGTSQYVLDGKTWVAKSREGVNHFDGYQVWSDGENIYYWDRYLLLPTTAKLYSRIDGEWVKTCSLS